MSIIFSEALKERLDEKEFRASENKKEFSNAYYFMIDDQKVNCDFLNVDVRDKKVRRVSFKLASDYLPLLLDSKFLTCMGGTRGPENKSFSILPINKSGYDFTVEAIDNSYWCVTVFSAGE